MSDAPPEAPGSGSLPPQGTQARRSQLDKRIRLSNVGAVFGALVMLVTSPFDLSEGSLWMVGLDGVGVAAFLSVPLLNRRGHVVLSRVVLTVLCTLLVLANAVVLGMASGSDLLFLALVAVPFAIFDMRERWMVLGLVLPVVGLAVTELGLLDRFARIPAGYSARTYHAYSAAVALAIILYACYIVSRANARAERALRLDIAARERAEQALADTRQASITAAKMAALGEMSANVAHEVNNPLAAILLRAERLEKLAGQGRLDTAATLRTAREITGTVGRIRRIVDALRSFARQGDLDPVQAESVLRIVSDTLELSGQRYRMSGIDLIVDPISPLLYADCRAPQVSQILMNLLSNAHDAVERTASPWVRIGVEEDVDQVRIVVTDSGRGIPPEIAARMMEPFFTTKAIGRGTGLGLSVSKGIAEAQGGRLELDRRSDRTRFVLTLRRSVSLPPERERRPTLHN